jgi:hypothetical protein
MPGCLGEVAKNARRSAENRRNLSHKSLISPDNLDFLTAGGDFLVIFCDEVLTVQRPPDYKPHIDAAPQCPLSRDFL